MTMRIDKLPERQREPRGNRAVFARAAGDSLCDVTVLSLDGDGMDGAVVCVNEVTDRMRCRLD